MLHRVVKVSATTVAIVLPAAILFASGTADRKSDPIRRVQHQTLRLTQKKPKPLHSVPTLPAPGRTAIIGAETPEQIPDDVVTSLFLRVVARGAASNDRSRLNSYLSHVGVPHGADEAVISLATHYELAVRKLNDRAAIERGISDRLSAADATALNKEKADLASSHRRSLVAAVGSEEKWSQISGNIKRKTTVLFR